MRSTKGPILVTGATGQQGGGTARALAKDGWAVRAFVRDPEKPAAQALAAAGAELVRGDFRDRASMARAVEGAYGVFSVQPSSGQPEYGVSDGDEERFGVELADVAAAAGVSHFVYTSMAGLVRGSGVGHFESKWRIEEHVRSSGLPATIVRPGAFMEILLQPHFALNQGKLVFFVKPDRTMRFIAGGDIGRVVARVFADPDEHVGRTVEIAGDALTGSDLATKISVATGRTVGYAQFAPEVLAQSPLLKRLVELVDEGTAVGDADTDVLRRRYPGLRTFDTWLADEGAAAISKLLPRDP